METAWRAVRMSPFWRAEHEKHLSRMRTPNWAIVVVARKLLIAIWHLLGKEETDVHASKEEPAYKMLLLSWSLKEETRMGLTCKRFPKYALKQLGFESDIRRLVRKEVPGRPAPREQVLMRMAELAIVQ